MVLNQEKSKGGNFYGYSKPAGFTGKSFEAGDFNGIDSSKIRKNLGLTGDPGGIRTRDLHLERVASLYR